MTETAVQQWGDEYPGESRKLARPHAESLQLEIERHVERLNDPQQDDERQRVASRRRRSWARLWSEPV